MKKYCVVMLLWAPGVLYGADTLVWGYGENYDPKVYGTKPKEHVGMSDLYASCYPSSRLYVPSSKLYMPSEFCGLSRKKRKLEERALRKRAIRKNYGLLPKEDMDPVYKFGGDKAFVDKYLREHLIIDEDNSSQRWETAIVYLTSQLVQCERRASGIDLMVKETLEYACSDAEFRTDADRERFTKYVKSVIIDLAKHISIAEIVNKEDILKVPKKRKSPEKQKINFEALEERESKKKAVRDHDRHQDYALQPEEDLDRVYKFYEKEKFVRGHLKNTLVEVDNLKPVWGPAIDCLVRRIRCGQECLLREIRGSEIDLIVKEALQRSFPDSDDGQKKHAQYVKSVVIGLSGDKCC